MGTFARGPRSPSGARTRPVMPIEGLGLGCVRGRSSRLEMRFGAGIAARGGASGRVTRRAGAFDRDEVDRSGGDGIGTLLEGEGDRCRWPDRAGADGGSRESGGVRRGVVVVSGDVVVERPTGFDLKKEATRAPGPEEVEGCEP